MQSYSTESHDRLYWLCAVATIIHILSTKTTQYFSTILNYNAKLKVVYQMKAKT
jgi:hypothetical protein